MYDGLFYGAGGFLLPNVSQYLAEEPSILEDGTEFYPFPHDRIDYEHLDENGWIDWQTLAILHEFNIFSPARNTYCNVLMVIESDPANGVLKTSYTFRPLSLSTPFVGDTMRVLLEIVFMLYMLALFLAELREMVQNYNDPKKLLIEHCVELRYQIRLKALNYGAFHGSYVSTSLAAFQPSSTPEVG